MQSFAPGDRVVAINTDMSGPICGPQNPEIHPFLFPDGPLRRDVVYHVTRVGKCRDGNQALWLTGMRVFWGPTEMSWSSTRFRKVQEAGHPPLAIKKKHPTPRVRPRERQHPAAPTPGSADVPVGTLPSPPLHSQANEDVGVPGTLPSPPPHHPCQRGRWRSQHSSLPPLQPPCPAPHRPITTRRAAAIHASGSFAANHQVLIFTCHPNHAGELQSLVGAKYFQITP